MNQIFSLRLSASPLRSKKVRLEHRHFRNTRELNAFNPDEVFNGSNIKSALVTRYDRFSYGHGAVVATVGFPIDADDQLLESAINAIKNSIREQAKHSGKQELIDMTEESMPTNQECLALLQNARQNSQQT